MDSDAKKNCPNDTPSPDAMRSKDAMEGDAWPSSTCEMKLGENLSTLFLMLRPYKCCGRPVTLDKGLVFSSGRLCGRTSALDK
jgi:hypothetical protein